MNNIIITLAFIVGLAVNIFNIKKFVHIMQLEGYKNNQFINWAIQNIKELIAKPLYVFLVPILLVLLLWNKNSIYSSI